MSSTVTRPPDGRVTFAANACCTNDALSSAAPQKTPILASVRFIAFTPAEVLVLPEQYRTNDATSLGGMPAGREGYLYQLDAILKTKEESAALDGVFVTRRRLPFGSWTGSSNQYVRGHSGRGREGG